jgi:hypothetical protein
VKSTSTISVPTLISGLSEIKEAGIPIQLVCGRHHSTVLTDVSPYHICFHPYVMLRYIYMCVCVCLVRFVLFFSFYQIMFYIVCLCVQTGAVFSWGATSFGRLGIHDLSSKKTGTPKRVTTLDHFAVNLN